MSAGYGYPAKVLFEGHLIVLLTSVLGRYYRALVIRKVCVGDGDVFVPVAPCFCICCHIGVDFALSVQV